MTKKDYEKIALAIATGEDIINLTLELAEIFQADNPRFDRKRFLEACGLLTFKA